MVNPSMQRVIRRSLVVALRLFFVSYRGGCICSRQAAWASHLLFFSFRKVIWRHTDKPCEWVDSLVGGGKSLMFIKDFRIDWKVSPRIKSLETLMVITTVWDERPTWDHCPLSKNNVTHHMVELRRQGRSRRRNPLVGTFHK